MTLYFRELIEPDGVDTDPNDGEKSDGAAFRRSGQSLWGGHGIDSDGDEDGDGQRHESRPTGFPTQDAEEHEKGEQGHNGKEGRPKQGVRDGIENLLVHIEEGNSDRNLGARRAGR